MSNGNGADPYIVAVQAPRTVQQGGGSQFNLAAETYSYEREALAAYLDGLR